MTVHQCRLSADIYAGGQKGKNPATRSPAAKNKKAYLKHPKLPIDYFTPTFTVWSKIIFYSSHHLSAIQNSLGRNTISATLS